jgi:adenylylsulfate kinase-like enzyme
VGSELIPVLWLWGPPGAGKTTVGWEVFEQLGQESLAVGFVDIDQLGMCCAPPSDPGRHRLKARALDAVITNFSDAGIQCVVVPGVTDPVRGIEPVPHADLTTCRLRASPAELARRIGLRGGATDLAEALRHAEAVDGAPGHAVDTTGLSVAEVARRVRDQTGWPDPPAPRRAALRPSEEPGEILLLCGPAAVGKSTVGWHVYQQLLRAGRDAAFVDLDQISFSRPGLGHDFRAANLAALWRTFRDAGADCLVAVGPFDQPEDVAVYRAALPAATITSYLLDASRDVLLERATRRAAGESPAPGLAGDVLLGQPPDRLAEIADRAARTVERLGSTGDLHVNTDHLPPDEIARRITTGREGPARS